MSFGAVNMSRNRYRDVINMSFGFGTQVPLQHPSTSQPAPLRRPYAGNHLKTQRLRFQAPSSTAASWKTPIYQFWVVHHPSLPHLKNWYLRNTSLSSTGLDLRSSSDMPPAYNQQPFS